MIITDNFRDMLLSYDPEMRALAEAAIGDSWIFVFNTKKGRKSLSFPNFLSPSHKIARLKRELKNGL